jgi:hypothetical protein
MCAFTLQKAIRGYSVARAKRLCGTVLLVIAVWGHSEVGRSQSTPWLTHEDRFYFVLTNPALIEGIRLRNGPVVPIKVSLVAFNEDCTAARLVRIAESGRVQCSDLGTDPLSVAPRRRLGGATSRLPEDRMAEIETLLKQLPDGLSNAPYQRRLLVRWRTADAWLARAYDRAALPSEITNLLCVVDVDAALLGAWAPRFKHERAERVPGSSPASLLIVSPEGKKAVWIAQGNELRVFNPRLQELATHPWSLGFGVVTDGQFNDDGRFLALHCEVTNQIDVLDANDFSPLSPIAPAEQIREFSFSRSNDYLVIHGDTSVRYDVRTGQKLEALSRIPEDTVWHQETRDNQRALVAGRNGALWLWSRAANATVSCLAEKNRLVRACFSPGDRFLAAFTRGNVVEGGQEPAVTLRVWDARTGAFVAELLPYDIAWKTPMVRALCWSSDEKYVLAASQADPFGKGCTIHAWHAQSGRHVANFVGPNRLNGFGLADEGRVLVAGSPAGVIYLWSFVDAIATVENVDGAGSRR